MRLTSWLQQVSNLVQKAAGAKVDPLDAHRFIQSVAEQPGAFLDYRLDAQGCLEAVVWALPEQVEAMQLYGDVWIQDNTCKTLAANRPFFAIVGVDGNSRYLTVSVSHLGVCASTQTHTSLTRLCVAGLGCSCRGCSKMSLESSSYGPWLQSSACARTECLSQSLQMQTRPQSWLSTPCSLAVASTGECGR